LPIGKGPRGKDEGVLFNRSKRRIEGGRAEGGVVLPQRTEDPERGNFIFLNHRRSVNPIQNSHKIAKKQAKPSQNGHYSSTISHHLPALSLTV
jgi:hypothetical protein